MRQILYQNLKSGQSRGCAKCHLDKVRPSFPPGATITPDQARKVKDLLGTGLNMAEVSRALGLTYYVVRGIARGTAWKDA